MDKRTGCEKEMRVVSVDETFKAEGRTMAAVPMMDQIRACDSMVPSAAISTVSRNESEQ